MVESGEALAQTARWKLDAEEYTAAVEFYAELIELNQEAIELRKRLASCKTGLFGIQSYRKLSSFEDEYVRIHDEIVTAQTAAVTGEPYRFGRVDKGFTGDAENDFNTYQDRMIKQAEGCFQEIERTRSLLTAKQSVAITRINITVASLILLCSFLLLVVSVL